MFTSVSFARFECVGEKFNFGVKATENENEYMGSIISKGGQLLLRVILNEGELEAQDKKMFSTAFTGFNSQEHFTLYIGKGKESSYLNIERNLGGNSTYQMICKKTK
jgi:outer membrane usher protein FimD/PapC